MNLSKVLADERRHQLIEYLNKHRRATVKELSIQLQVTEATLRADLNLLEEEGVVKRIHGGAVLAAQNPTGATYNFSAREKRNTSQKAAIGRKAMELVQDGQCILIDASTTALELAKCLKKSELNLTVVTSGVYTALELKENPQIHVILIGGVLRMGSGSVEGVLGTDILGKIKADRIFTSPAGFKLDSGLMDFNMYEVELKRRMVEATDQVIALMDSSKFNVGSIASYADTSRIHMMITDDGAPGDQIAELRKRNIDVVTVKV